MYELFLLGKLLARPWYGYEFQQVLAAFVGPARKISWGTIYPLFRRLQKQGLIRAISVRSQDGGPERHSYTITAAGKERFHELMREEQTSNSDYREAFRAKLGNFSRVDKETRRKICQGHLQRILAIQAHTTEQLSIVKGVANLRSYERKMILQAIDHERSLAEAELAWMRTNVMPSLRSVPDSRAR